MCPYHWQSTIGIHNTAGQPAGLGQADLDCLWLLRSLEMLASSLLCGKHPELSGDAASASGSSGAFR